MVLFCNAATAWKFCGGTRSVVVFQLPTNYQVYVLIIYTWIYLGKIKISTYTYLITYQK